MRNYSSEYFPSNETNIWPSNYEYNYSQYNGYEFKTEKRSPLEYDFYGSETKKIRTSGYDNIIIQQVEKIV